MIEYEKSYKIPVYNTGHNGRLTITSLMNYIQDISAEHAELLGFGRESMLNDNKYWILSRAFTDIKEFPLWGETVTLKTWPRGTEGLFALRDIEVRTDKGRIVANATTSWVIVDIEKKMVQRPDTLIEKLNIELSDEAATGRNSQKIDLIPGEASDSPPFKVRPSDIDINEHANNVKYIQWVYDSIPLNEHREKPVTAIEINYLKEAKEGDIIIIRSAKPPQESNCTTHTILRVTDGKELCRVMLYYKGGNQKVF
jgi:medium-chain acyl-[acyl-carrier-protein] hydrolase